MNTLGILLPLIAIALSLWALFGKQLAPLASRLKSLKINWWAVIVVAELVALLGIVVGPRLPMSWPALPTLHEKPTAVTYVYEKDDGDVPVEVRVAFNVLNRQGIQANPFEDDTRDGAGEVPDQYKVALEAANKAGIPALVATAGPKVIRVVKAPTKVEEVLEAAK